MSPQISASVARFERYIDIAAELGDSINPPAPDLTALTEALAEAEVTLEIEDEATLDWIDYIDQTDRDEEYCRRYGCT